MILRSTRLTKWLLVLAIVSCIFARDSGATISNDRASNESLVWGPFRPNLYFGVRPRVPKGLTTGLLWARVEDYQSVQNTFRYTCEQSDGMAGYGWEEYDVRTGGRQLIHDVGNHIDIMTSFVKIPGGAHGGSWGARIAGVPRKDAAADLKTTVVLSAAVEGLGTLELDNDYDSLGCDSTVTFKGRTEELGEFKLEVTPGPVTNAHPHVNHRAATERPLDRTRVKSLQVPEGGLWQAKAYLFQNIQEELEAAVEEYGTENLPPPWQAFTISHAETQPGNLYLVQKVFEGAFEFDILFSSLSATEPVTSNGLSREIKAISKGFSDRYQEVFKASTPFDKSKYDHFSKAMFSNLLGGIAYFYGDQVIDRSYAPEYDEENEGFWEETAEVRSRQQASYEGPFELTTAIPARSFFPRGFLWDEGFHLLPIIEWDASLTLEIVRSWFNLMDKDGWIAREQIIGAEARSKVPAEFTVQYPHYANPPTLFLVLEVMLDKLDKPITSSDDKLAFTSTLRNLYPLLKRHYYWYRKTQSGDLKSYDRPAFSKKEGYRWRGRTPSHILTSGLDDYPRPQPPHPGELHVDLMSWMGLMTRIMERIAVLLKEGDDAGTFSELSTAIRRNLDDLHWDDVAKTYCDASVDDYEEHIHVCHKGYVSIFPFMTGMLEANSPRLGAVLDLINDGQELWSDHGIRSLSKQDPLYGTDENYWRSPVWINMNYLILDNLLRIAQSKGPHQARARDMYNRLRRNLVDTVYKSWEDTGFAWEQYNPESGFGQRTQHFTGWTSLVVKVLVMPDLSQVEHGEL